LFDHDTLELGPFRWFGGAPGDRIPDLGERVARHSKGNSEGHKAERKNIRVINKGRFTQLQTIEEISRLLFGGVLT
jgi:hypothetical protein